MTKSRTRIRSVLNVIRGIERQLDRRRVYPPSNTYADVVLLALLAKTLRVARAVCYLVEKGYADEAFGLGRTLIDIHLTARYISNKNSDERAEQYAKFTYKEKESWLKVIEKYYSGSSILDPSNTAQKQVLKEAKAYPNPNWWTGKGSHTRDLALEEDTQEIDSSGNPISCEFDYRVIYRWTSHYVHCSASTLHAYVPTRFGVFRSVPGRRPHRVDRLAIFNAMIYTAKTAITVLRYLGTPLSSRTDNRLKLLLKQL